MSKLALIPIFFAASFSCVSHASTVESVRQLGNEAQSLYQRSQRSEYLLQGAEQYKLARALNNQAMQLAEKELDTHPEILVDVLKQQASFYEGNLKKAETVLLRIISIQEKSPAMAGRDLATTLNWLAFNYLAQDNPNLAEKTLLRAIETIQSKYGENDIELVNHFALLGKIYLAKERLDEAEVALKRALTLGEENNASNIYWLQSALGSLEKIYQNTNRSELAKQIADKLKNTKPFVSSVANVKPEGKFKNPEIKKDTCPAPQYPREALRYELQGVTQIRFLVSESGEIMSKYVLRSSGWKILDQAVFDSISVCQFEPASLNDKPVPAWFGSKYSWKLADDGPALPPSEMIAGSCSSDKYTFLAKDAKHWLVRLRFLINPQGKPVGIKVEDSSRNYSTDSEIVALLGSCQFVPPVIQDKRINDTGVILFDLKENTK